MAALPGLTGAVAAGKAKFYQGADAVFLLHLDGANGSTTYTDEIANLVPTAAGGTHSLSTTSPKFGTASLLFNNGYIRYNAEAIFTFNSGTDFTIDFWFRPDSVPSAGVYRSLFDSRSSSSTSATSRIIIAQYGSGLHFNLNGTAYNTTSGVSANTWHHIALTRSGTNVYMFLDGVLLNTRTSDSVNYAAGANRPVIGVDRNLTDTPYYGRIDEFRIRKGTAQWTTAFTPPTSAYVP